MVLDEYNFQELNDADFYSLITSLLVSQAKSENKDVYLDYSIAENVTCDAYFPNGLSVFRYDDNQPVIVEIKRAISSYQINEELSKMVTDIGGHLSFITFQEGYSGYLYKHFDSRRGFFDFEGQSFSLKPLYVIFGKAFVEKLCENNPYAYINAILGDSRNTITKKELEDNQGLDYFISNEKKTIERRITEKTSGDLSDLNEELFKSYFPSQKESIRTSKSNVALFIGNGASIPFGSDSWSDLIDNIVDCTKPYFIQSEENIKKTFCSSSYAIASFVKSMYENEGLSNNYIESLYYCIYRKFNKLMLKKDSLIKTIAEGKEKYPNMPLLTYNYDTFIEQAYFIRLRKKLGYFTYNPSVDSETFPFEQNVIHLHGYLSYAGRKHYGLILSDLNYYDAYLEKDSWVYKTQIDTLQNYKCLFVGSSMSDLFQMSLIEKAKRESSLGKWSCFALMCLNDLEEIEKIRVIKYYKERGINIILADDFGQLPKKLRSLLKL